MNGEYLENSKANAAFGPRLMVGDKFVADTATRKTGSMSCENDPILYGAGSDFKGLKNIF
jgi:hypothetical protein